MPEAVLGAGVRADLVALAEWMAREYCSTPARALSLMLAPGAAEGTGARRVLVAELTAGGRAALARRRDAPHRRPARAADRAARRGPAVAARSAPPALRRLEGRGLVALEQRAARPPARSATPVGAAVGDARRR